MSGFTHDWRDNMCFIVGRIDEHANFDALRAAAPPTLRINFQGLEGINSSGVRRLAQFVISLGNKPYEFYACTRELVDMINIIPDILGSRGPLSVQSLYVPYHCERCHATHNYLVEMREVTVAGHQATPPERRCHVCSGPTKLDEYNEDYFSFIEAQGD